MDTDHIFYELFLDHLDWLRDFSGLPLPEECKGSSLTLKQLEIRCDLLLTPKNPQADPHYLIEFQLYHDHSIFNRVELARQIIWKQLNSKKDCRRIDYQPCQVEAAIIFGSEADLPNTCSRSSEGIRILFIDELLDQLKENQPNSPLLAALNPLKDSKPELEKRAAQYYDVIQSCPDLTKDDREVLNEIFLNILFQRFKTKSRKTIQAMIAELTPIKETRVGQELLKEGMQKGREEERRLLVWNMQKNGMSIETISKAVNLSETEIADILSDNSENEA